MAGKKFSAALFKNLLVPFESSKASVNSFRELKQDLPAPFVFMDLSVEPILVINPRCAKKSIPVEATKKLCASVFSRKMMDEVHHFASLELNVLKATYVLYSRTEGPSIAKNLINGARSVQENLPIWMAKLVVELDKLPYGLSKTPAILKVRQEYLDSFCEIRSFPSINTIDDENKFKSMIEDIKARHQDVVSTMVLGVEQLKNGGRHILERILDREYNLILPLLFPFWTSIIGINFQIENHLMKSKYIGGCVDKYMNPKEVAQCASEEARLICIREYGTAPNIEIHAYLNDYYTFVRSHLHIMIFELVKNALRAVQERFAHSDKRAPPIKIIIMSHNVFAPKYEGLTIKVSDEGGGIRIRDLTKIFKSFHTTKKSLMEHPNLETTGFDATGFGYGLPLSRLYARFFGGDLKLISMEGYGTDAYIILPYLGFDRKLYWGTLPSFK